MFITTPANHLVRCSFITLRRDVVESLDLPRLGNLSQTHVKSINAESGLELLYLLNMP